MKKRIHLKKKKKIKLLWIIIFILFIFIISFASQKISKNAKIYASSEIKKIITQNITSVIGHVKINENIFEVEKDDNQIKTINVNNSILNETIEQINKDIENKLDSIENTIIFKMPLLAPTNNVFLSNIGFKIPIRFKVIGNVVNNLRTEVKNYGINNALITTYADVKIECSVILPLTSENIEIFQTITLTTKIIQGQIPNYYIPVKNST